MIVYIHMIYLLIWLVKLRSHWLKVTCNNKLHSGSQLNYNSMALHDSNCNMDMLHVDIGTVFKHVRKQTLTITRCHFIPLHPLWCFQLYNIITFFSIKAFFLFYRSHSPQRTKWKGTTSKSRKAWKAKETKYLRRKLQALCIRDYEHYRHWHFIF
jgi:hypothetical protein